MLPKTKTKNAAAVRQKLVNKTLKLLSYRPRSLAEIRLRLRKLTDSNKLIDQVIDQFIDQNLLNDQDFAVWWVDQRLTHRPRGNIALTNELLKKGISRDIINSVLLSHSQEVKVIKQLLKTKSTTSKSRAYQFLRTRGFTSESIAAAIDELGLKE